MHGSRMLKMTPSFVLGRVPPCKVTQAGKLIRPLPAALLGCHFEHPAQLARRGEG